LGKFSLPNIDAVTSRDYTEPQICKEGRIHATENTNSRNDSIGIVNRLSCRRSSKSFNHSRRSKTNESRIYVGKCLFPLKNGDQQAQYLLKTDVVGALVEPLVDIVLGSIQAAAADETLLLDSPFPVTKALYKLNQDGVLQVHGDLQCLQVITGQFSGDGSQAVAADLDKEVKSVDKSLVRPRIFFEAAFVGVPGSRNAMALKPRFLSFLGPEKKSFWETSAGSRNLSINLSFQALGSDSAFGNLVIPFREISPDTILGVEYFEATQLKPITLPPLDKSEKEVVDVARAELKEANKLINAEKPDDWRTKDEFATKLAIYCNSWDAYVSLLRKRHQDNMVKEDFVAPPNESCPTDIRLHQLRAEADKAKLLAVIDNVDRNAALKRNRDGGISGSIKCDLTSCVLAEPLIRDYFPIVISASVVEVREASAFNKHLAAIAQSMKTPVVTALKNATPSSKEAAEKAAQEVAAIAAEALEVNKEKYYLAKANADAAYETWSTAKEDTKSAAWIAFVDWRNKANAAARLAKLTPPFKID
jgi:hypothetical protein